jgi:hypothetical protein
MSSSTKYVVSRGSRSNPIATTNKATVTLQIYSFPISFVNATGKERAPDTQTDVVRMRMGAMGDG